jgi:hypothetical protein
MDLDKTSSTRTLERMKCWKPGIISHDCVGLGKFIDRIRVLGYTDVGNIPGALTVGFEATITSRANPIDRLCESLPSFHLPGRVEADMRR